MSSFLPHAVHLRQNCEEINDLQTKSLTIDKELCKGSCKALLLVISQLSRPYNWVICEDLMVGRPVRSVDGLHGEDGAEAKRTSGT